MVTLVSETQSKEEMAEALNGAGLTTVEAKPPEEKTPPKEPEPEPKETADKEKTEPSGKPATEAEKPKQPAIETAAESETAETKKQEPSPKTDEKIGIEKEEQLSTGKVKAQIHKLTLTSQRETFREQLEAERGDKSKLHKQIAELEAKLAELAPAPKIEEPAKPKRPTRAQFDFDDEKYEAAMDAYDAQQEAYNATLTNLPKRRKLL